MRVMLDTHVVIWAVDDPRRLSRLAESLLREPATQLLISAATVWEISIKVGLGKPALSERYRKWMFNARRDLGATLLPITIEYADVQATLPHHHRDPFDRLLAAQALSEDIPLVSADPVIETYGVSRIW